MRYRILLQVKKDTFQKVTCHTQGHNLSPSEKSTRHLQDTFMLFGGNFDLFLQIVIRVYSDHLLTRCLKLGNVFNELLVKSLYLLPLFKLGKVVSATGFEPVNLACKPLKTLDLFLPQDSTRHSFVFFLTVAIIIYIYKTGQIN